LSDCFPTDNYATLGNFASGGIIIMMISLLEILKESYQLYLAGKKFRNIPRKLWPLALEAEKYDNFEKFSQNYSVNLMRGRYWHITDDKNFDLKEVGPRDLSSLASGEPGEVGLMVSYTPGLWRTYFPKRKFAVEIDLSDAKEHIDYSLVARGFGHEIFVNNLRKIKIGNVVSIQSAIKASNNYNSIIPQNKEDLYELWQIARKNK